MLSISLASYETLESDLEALSKAKRSFVSPGCPNYPAVVRASITNAKKRLSKFSPDMIIVIPIQSGMSLDTSIRNLQELELPMKAGVIIALDMIQTIDHKWLEMLEVRLKTVASRYEYVYIFFTSNMPPEKWLNRACLDLVKGVGDSYFAKWRSLGSKDMGGLMYPYYVVREDTRILVKHLSCRYVMLFDADVKPRVDVLYRLVSLIEGQTQADLAAGWYFERCMPFNEPAFEPIQAILPETAEDKLHIERCRRVEEQVGIEMGDEYWMSHKQLSRMQEPIAIKWVGGGCVMMKKQLNDEISFFRLFPMAEDVNFCYNARAKGFKLFLDPQCFCFHDEE